MKTSLIQTRNITSLKQVRNRMQEQHIAIYNTVRDRHNYVFQNVVYVYSNTGGGKTQFVRLF